MPKENIIDMLGFSTITIRWGRDLGDVQLGVEKVNGKIQIDGTDFSGLWATVNRDQINSLIRSLRKARDQAFGSDA